MPPVCGSHRRKFICLKLKVHRPTYLTTPWLRLLPLWKSAELLFHPLIDLHVFSHSLTLSHSSSVVHLLTLSLIHPFTLSLTLPHSISYSLTLSVSLFLTHYLAHVLTFSITPSFFLPHSSSLTHPNTLNNLSTVSFLSYFRVLLPRLKKFTA